MIYECRVYKPSGELDRVIPPKDNQQIIKETRAEMLNTNKNYFSVTSSAPEGFKFDPQRLRNSMRRGYEKSAEIRKQKKEAAEKEKSK
jgi:sugar-specific transcriptional regulator TrmB